MRKGLVGLVVLIVLHYHSTAQVDTSYVYKTGLPYGTLDIRIAKSSTRFYYLQENRTVSFREKSPGVKTNTYRDMTSWDSSPYSEGNMREENGSGDAFIMNYRLLYPNNYSKTTSPGYPLVVFIHGAGERANCWKNSCYHATPTWNPNTNSPVAPTAADSKVLNNDHNLLHGGSAHLSARNAAGSRLPSDPSMPSRAFQGFVLFPQCLNGWNGSSVQDAIKLVRLVIKKYNIDPNRVYIEGLSNGGYGVYEAIKRAPWLFASAITMSAVSDANISGQNLQSKIAHIPIWTFQGGQDRAPSPGTTEKYVKNFRAAGAVVKYTLYDNLGHGTWNSAFKEPDFYKWMWNHNKSNIHTFAGSTAICGTNNQGVRMELAEGFRAYQWEKDGAVIAGANSATYVASSPGTYRARFSRKANPGSADWNQWSKPVTVTKVNPAPAKIDQVGTVHLKDLNGYADARLSATGTFAKYYWYKNGIKLNVPDSNQSQIFKAGDCSSGKCAGNGAYTLVVANFDNCPSPPSQAKYVFFNNQSPVNINAPGNFNGTQPNASSVKLTWTDTSTNESGFEIWRRKSTSSTSYTKWEMRGLTAANVATFTDTGIDPSSTYAYKVRAVGNAGRSNYTPATTDLKITTTKDSVAPTAPTNLKAVATAIREIQLSWSASNDNSGIKRYRIYYGSQSVLTDSNATNYTLTNLNLNTNYSFTVKAEDLGGNLSGASNAAAANTYVNGLFYKHSTGAWTDLDQINWTGIPEFTGKVTTFTLAPRTQEDFFNFEFDGYLYINKAGTYYFQTTSSDGSRLELDGTVLVNNDGIHASRSNTSPGISLTVGAKRINVKYFENDESHVLTVKYKGPDTGNSFIVIPATALKSGTSGTSIGDVPEEESALAASMVTVYPNPTTQDDINLQIESGQLQPVEVKVIDFTGREVYRKVFESSEVTNGVRIMPQETMKDGMYLMLINESGKVTQRRISIKN